MWLLGRILLNYGTVTIDTERASVDFTLKQDILLTSLYPSYIHHYIDKHLDITRNLLHVAFLRLIIENEAPAIIIADVLKQERDEAKGE